MVVTQRENMKSLWLQMSTELDSLTSLLVAKNERIDANLNFIEEEIEIRIESLKSELDELHEKYREQLRKIRVELKNRLKSTEYERTLIRLQNDIQMNELNEENYFKYQHTLENLRELIKKCEETKHELSFYYSNETIDEKLVGKIIRNESSASNLHADEILNKLESENFETFNLNVKPLDVCVLPNNCILTVNSGGSLTIFNEDFNLVRKIDKLDNKPFDARGVVLNDRNELYVTNIRNNTIVMLDLDFKVLKTIGLQDSGEKLHHPSSLYCKNYHLYVCDSFNHRIQVYNLDLEFIETIQLNYYPSTIKLTDSSIAIHNLNGTRFYNSQTKQFKSHAQQPSIGRLSEINSDFYVIVSQDKCVCYNNEGSLVREVQYSNEQLKQLVSTNLDGFLLVLNKKLILFSNCKQQAIRF